MNKPIKMDIKIIHSPSPFNSLRKMALVYINGKLDEPIAKWIAKMAISGGRYGGKAATLTLRNAATELASLYEELAALGKYWYEATESDLEYIRNAYLRQLPEGTKYVIEKVEQSTMRTKMLHWIDFFSFQKCSGQALVFNPTFTTGLNRNQWKLATDYLGHLNRRPDVMAAKAPIAKWALLPPASPKKKTYHALSEKEFRHFCKRLRDIDVVFEIIAIFMQETGLRLSATLEIECEVFDNWFAYLNGGKELDDYITVEYNRKGHEFLSTTNTFRLYLHTIEKIQRNYRADGNIYEKRRLSYKKRLKKDKRLIVVDTFWYKESIIGGKKMGKAVSRDDVWDAFGEASKAMGRKGKDIITAHWMRHTFATYIVINYLKKRFDGTRMDNTGIALEHEILVLLSDRLDHVDIQTSKQYIATAYDILGWGNFSGLPPLMSQRAFLRDQQVQDEARSDAKHEFGIDFDESKFDPLNYAIARGLVQNDN